jgi:hypothetical protein
MITVKIGSLTFEGAKAIKGSNYIRVLDSNDNLVASIDGITSFSGITISGGSWTTPAAASNCEVAVIMADGTVAKGNVKNCDILTNTKAITLKSGTHYGTSLPSSGTTGQLFFKLVD